ncbi:hypothetical protein AD006_05865 [Pseudonocardia sp. EC080610-09]|uniref:DUF6802 family protein n=1 Tax=unclassified Pseudonocardia TaxID=2619320 RepID=UPI0006CB7A64|nr:MULTISPECIES: DUF6802 family protein [unclassified Pseudonocardia]ALE75576.1 hypothetical protein FRP1_26680 [Pseudonocardia sp. EC080625-04]ALL74951.1 hypothetical protein AD006_05865 [Pseudonocardia sp. EC080610-09]ALL81973.1 hypothetical protein AD017_13685 [Pseudonocardia sp. EC080619-01]
MPAVRWPWGTTAAAAAAGAAPWWLAVPVPRGSGNLPAGGPRVPVSGPAARDTDGDGAPDALVVDVPGGTSIWSDLDGDGLADHVRHVGPFDDLVARTLEAGR